MIAQIDKKYIRLRPFKALTRIFMYLLFEGRPLTTKGRWINTYVFFFFSLIDGLPLFKKVKKTVYILGTGRSGTTILGVILSIHKKCVFLNEPKALWHFVQPNEDLVGNYTNADAKYRLTDNDVMQENIDRLHKLYGACFTISKADVLVDKYPEMIYRTSYLSEINPGARYIFLIRNGWDTCSSIKKWSEKHKGQNENQIVDWWGKDKRKWRLLVMQLVPEHDDLKPYINEILNFDNHIDMAALEWLITMREGIKICQQHPGSVLKVRYEDLTSNTGLVLKEIEDFLELESDCYYYKYASETLRVNSPVSPMPLHPILMGPFVDMMISLGYSD